jgi:CHAT domain-containing protein
LTEREKKEFWKKISQDFEFFKTIAFENNNKTEIETVYNNALSTKGILLNSTKQLRDAIELSNNASLKATFNEWSSKNEVLTRAISMNNDQLREENIDLENLQKEIDKLEKSLSANSKDFASQNTTKVTTWKDVRDALKVNEYAVEIIRYNKFNKDFTDTIIYKALIIGKDYSTPKVIDFTSGNKIDGKYLNYYRNTTKFKKTDLLSYKIFYEPIHKVVGDNAIVYVSLEGAFNLINLEAMLIKDSTYVMDKNQVIIVPSTKDIINKSNTLVSNNNKSSLIISNPIYYEANNSATNHGNATPDAPWKQLSGAEREGEIIDSMFRKDNWKSTLVKWDKADENIIKQIGKNEYKDISYLHIATHGFFEEAAPVSLASSLDSRRGLDDPYLRAGLLFKNAGDVMKGNDVLNYNISDGVLTAKEISTLNLRGLDIVVLSACETGLGDIASGEGVYGLQRAFLAAGVKMVVISLFKVDDIVTTKFMEKMSSKFLETKNPRISIEYAKKEIQKEYKDPIYWGSFILVD